MLSITIFGFICLSSFLSAQAQPVFEERISSIETSYLESKNELEDYILDTGDTLNIEFINVPDVSELYTQNAEGQSLYTINEQG